MKLLNKKMKVHLIIFFLIIFSAAAGIFISKNIKAEQTGDLFRIEGAESAVKTEPVENQVSEPSGAFSPLPREYIRLPKNTTLAVPWKNKEAEKISFPVSAAAAMDNKSRVVIFNQDSDEQLSIASITKLVTALVFLDNNPGWDYEHKITSADKVEGGREYLFPGEIIKARDLFYLSLVGSANTAALALVHSTGLNEASFTEEMNKKAQALGLKKTTFADSTGLSRRNVSTAKEVAVIAGAAFDNKEIREAALTEKYEFATKQGKNKIVYNTDKLIGVFPKNGLSLLGGKTGYTESSGFCFVGKFSDEQNNEIISVILGAKNIDSRFKYAKELAQWVFDSYNW